MASSYAFNQGCQVHLDYCIYLSHLLEFCPFPIHLTLARQPTEPNTNLWQPCLLHGSAGKLGRREGGEDPTSLQLHCCLVLAAEHAEHDTNYNRKANRAKLVSSTFWHYVNGPQIIA
jgi:hypothetical protein